ncbi:MAG: NUDIX hydrolase [Promethearchaeota archaeon]
MKIIKTANLITIDDKKRVLLIERAHNQEEPNLWSLPGGTKRDNETLEECLVREIKEELNSSIKKYGFLKLYIMKEDNKTVIANYYVGLINNLIKLNKQESSKYRWFIRKEIPSNLAYNQNNVLSDFFNS